MGMLSLPSSSNRWIHIESPLGRDELMAERIKGGETLGRLFEYDLIALSKSGDIDFNELLGHHLTVHLQLAAPGQTRFIDGRVTKVSLVGMNGRLFRYHITLRPWLWMLTRTADCKIFQDKNVQDILEEVFADQPDADFEFQLTDYYHPRTYCVQYRETDFNFISRLLEEEGIYYFFKHEKGKHTMVICDAESAHESIGTIEFRPENRPPRDGVEYVEELSFSKQIQPGKKALRDFNFETPTSDLLVQIEVDRDHGESEHEIYDYPGRYVDPESGDFVVRHRLEEIQTEHELIEGHCDVRNFTTGSLFDLIKFGREDLNSEYLIQATEFEAVNNAIETGGPEQDASYDCWFQLFGSGEAFRSKRSTPVPTVKGPQTATVVGPDNEEIHVDEYGRVKVQFHWDRYGENNDQSSCWIRVSQIWAGKNYGWMTIPRIGQEVIVSFLEGDPDRPIITGRVYNADQMPPWELPSNKTQSGLLTRSSKDGSPETANQLRFEDKKDEEQIYFHAEKDMDRHIENNDSTYVGNDKFLTVERDQKNTIKRDRWETIERDQNLSVNRDRITNIKNNETRVVDVDQILKVSGNQSQTIVGNQDVKIESAQTEEVTGTVTQKTADKRVIETGTNDVRIVGADQVFNVTGNISYKAAKITLEAGHIDFKVTGGNSMILESPAGPYQMMVNKLEIMSNTDVNILAVANINQVSMGNNTTVMGSNGSSYVGSASDTMLAMSRNTFIGMQMDGALALSMNNFIGLSLENALAAKVETAAGPHAELNSLKTYAPGGGGGGAGAGGPAALSGGWAAASALAAGAAAGVGIVNAILGIHDTKESYNDAITQLQNAADAAASAGHPNLATRLRGLAASSPVSQGLGNFAAGMVGQTDAVGGDSTNTGKNPGSSSSGSSGGTSGNGSGGSSDT